MPYTAFPHAPLFPACSGLFGMGVADGVYAWRAHDIDSGELSRALMEKCKQMIQDGTEDTFQGVGGEG